MAQGDPALVLSGATPRLIDECQIRPQLWNHVRHEVDPCGGSPGPFILTGSAVPADDLTRHTGASHMSRLRIHPMSSLKSGHSAPPARSFDGRPTPNRLFSPALI